MTRAFSRPAAALWLVTLTSCMGTGNRMAATWRENDYLALPTALSGLPVLIYPIGRLILEPSVDGAAADPAAVSALADSVFHAALVLRAPQVSWISAVFLRRQAAEHDSLPDLETVDLSALPLRALMTVPQPLLDQMRTLSQVTAGRHAFIPGQVAVRRLSDGRYRVEAKLVMSDVRVGGNGWASDAAGEGTTLEGAFEGVIARIAGSTAK